MKLSVSLPDQVVAAVQARAEADNRSLSNMISTLLQEALTAGNVTATWTTAPPLGVKEFRGPDPKAGRK